MLEPVGLRLERGEEGAEVGADLAQPQLEVAQLLAGRCELRCEPLERGQRALGGGREPGRALPLVRRERLGGAGGSLGELGDVPQPLALVAQRLLAAGLEALRRLDERGQLAQARLLGGGPARQLVVALAGRAELPPRQPGLTAAAELLLADEGVEHVELVGGAAEAALLELARHRDQALGGGGEVLARDGAAPGVGARAAVAEDAPGQHEPGLVLGRQLGERGELVVVEEPLRDVELGLDVGLAAGRADDAGVALRPEQQADRLGQDRLAGARLAGDRRQARPRAELAFADEDEVLDAQATKQRSGCSG